jgi:hypothetical protein
VFLIVCCVHQALWALFLYYALVVNPSAVIGRDWFTLREVAKSFVAGAWDRIYDDLPVAGGVNYFRYPPFVLYIIAPLGIVPTMVAYAIVCVVQILAAAGMLTLLFCIKKPADHLINVAAVFGSAAMVHVIVSGQNSAVLALVIAAVGYCLARGQNVAAGVCVGLLICKPNWLPIFGLFALWQGGLRAGAAAALTGLAFMLSTIPFGLGLWHDFVTMTTRAAQIAATYQPYKEITLLAALRSVFEWTAMTRVLWAVGLLVLAAFVVWACRDDRSIGRRIGLVTLLAVVANPYASFYDGFVLAVPATVWFTHRDGYSPLAWRTIGAWIAAYWIWDMVVFYYRPILFPFVAAPPLSAAGFLLAGWLISEALAIAHDGGSASRKEWQPVVT